jgi:hypothetical protein
MHRLCRRTLKRAKELPESAATLLPANWQAVVTDSGEGVQRILGRRPWAGSCRSTWSSDERRWGKTGFVLARPGRQIDTQVAHNSW